ncbi:MAG: hypothetical protein AAF215_33600 [Cyanobacteria bacterium P01_A01_bin.123]
MLVMRHGAIASQGSGGATDADAQAFIGRLTASYSTAELDAINAFFVGLKADGLYTTIDLIYLNFLDNITDALLNIKGTSFTGSNISGAHVAGQGITGAINTGFNPVTAGGNWAQNSALALYYSRTNSQSTSREFGINDGGSPSDFSTNLTRTSANQARWGINISGTAETTSNITDSTGLWVVSRTSSSTHALYRDGTLSQSASESSVAPPSLNMYFGAENRAGSATDVSSRQLAMMGLASGWDATQVSNFNTLVDDLQTVFGF